MIYYFTLHYATPQDVILAARGNDQQHNLSAADIAAMKTPPAQKHGLPANSSYQVIQAAAQMYGIPLLPNGRHVLIAASPNDLKLWVVAGPY
jgi:hypothetical protein